MNKPIYRHLANQKWREYKRPLVMQRITQMSVVPDVLPSVDPTAAVALSFPGRKIQPGEFVESLRSQFPPNLKVDVFDAGPRLVTVVVVDSDVPNVEADSFENRLHGIWTNIEITPTEGHIFPSQLDKDSHEVMPWLPPYAQKGSPYHRLSIFVLQQNGMEPIATSRLQKLAPRDNFSMRDFVDGTKMKVVGVSMFRTQFDEGMLELMRKYNLPGADIMLKRREPGPLPYKRRDTRRMRG
jgi:large subunit ribosomal protein L35